MSGSNGSLGHGGQSVDEEGAELDFMEMPKGMRTYSMPDIPKAEEAKVYGAAFAKLTEVLSALGATGVASQTATVDLTELDAPNRDFISQVLGEGEVSIIAGAHVQVQESVLTGVWRLQETSASGTLIRDVIEVGEFPSRVIEIAQKNAKPALPKVPVSAMAELMNAPSLIAELAAHLAAYETCAQGHVINLSLLPLSDADLLLLEHLLGKGEVTVLSRGYGNCRISSTGVKNAWWVRYFNSREAIILTTIEVVGIPPVALAASEDLKDSAERLAEILEVYA